MHCGKSVFASLAQESHCYDTFACFIFNIIDRVWRKFADVLTTIAVIVGWQLSARGYPWLDTVFALLVASLVLYLAYGLFRRAIPRLVDSISHEPEEIAAAVTPLDGVRKVHRVRSRWVGSKPAVDVVITVAPEMPTSEAHDIADAVEKALLETLSIEDVTVHIEPDDD